MKLQASPNQSTSESHERLVDFWAAFIPNTQASKLMQPGQGALDHPTENAQATPVGRVAFSQQGLDAECPQPTTMRFRIIAAIPLDALWTTTGSSRLATHRKNRFHQRFQLRDIVCVRAGQDRGQGETLCIGDDMVLAARLRFIRWIGPCFVPLLGRARVNYPLRLATNQFG